MSKQSDNAGNRPQMATLSIRSKEGPSILAFDYEIPITEAAKIIAFIGECATARPITAARPTAPADPTTPPPTRTPAPVTPADAPDPLTCRQCGRTFKYQKVHDRHVAECRGKNPKEPPVGAGGPESHGTIVVPAEFEDPREGLAVKKVKRSSLPPPRPLANCDM